MSNETSRRADLPVVCAGVVVADHLCTPISHLPAAGELVAADDLILNIGGCASNASMDLARLGVKSAVCGKVGDDVFGRFVEETLVAQGVDVSCLSIDPSRPTSQTLIVNVKGQDRRFIHSVGANRGLTPGDLVSALSTNPKVLYVGGYLILPGLEANALADCFRNARRGGVVTVLDVATPGPANYLKHLTPVLPETDVFLPNSDEAALILGERDPLKQALTFHEMGAGHVIITRGEFGAVAVSKQHRVMLGPYPVEFVDGSGSGDAFDAGYILGILEDLDELDRLRLAGAIGASCVRAVGTTAGVFTRQEAADFMARNTVKIEAV